MTERIETVTEWIRGVEVERIGVIINPKVEEEAPKAEELPS